MKKTNDVKVAFIADLHIPYNDRMATIETLRQLKTIKPDIVVLGGDIVDFYAISHFRKDPARANRLQAELDDYATFMDSLRAVFRGPLIYLIGNHETWLKKYLCENPEMHGLRALTLESILDAKKYRMGIMYEWEFRGMLFTHGTNVSRFCANAELIKYGQSGISGHKHSYNVAARTDRNGQVIWLTAPCLCDFKEAEYVHDPNWQLGFVVLNFGPRRLESYETKLLGMNRMTLGGGSL